MPRGLETGQTWKQDAMIELLAMLAAGFLIGGAVWGLFRHELYALLRRLLRR